jgi:hypothetical protein
MPAFAFTMNKVLFSKFSHIPQGLFEADKPLFSGMYFTKDFTEKTSRYGFYLKGLGKRYTTNSIGLRLPKINLSKDQILFSGDSTIFGAGINDTETVAYLMGDKLTNKYGVINAGIPGKNIPHNLLTLMNFIETFKTQNVHIKYFINWIHGSDFEYQGTLEDINNRALKFNLNWKQELKVRYPFLAEVWWALRKHGGLGGPAFFPAKLLFLEKRNYDFKRNTHPFKKPQSEALLGQNEEYFKDIQILCEKNNIVLLNVIHASTYKDIVSYDGYSEYLESILIRNKAKHIIKTKDIYWLKPEILPYLPTESNDFAHFSMHGAKITADHLASLIKTMDAISLPQNNSLKNHE